MSEKPALKITYDDNGRPVAAHCSACDESMPQGEPRVTDAEALKKWFEKGFAAHVRHKHSGEDGDEPSRGRA